MTVEEVADNRCQCVWFINGKYESKVFQIETLEMA